MRKAFQRAAGAASPDLYSQVTNRIIASLEAGVRPWQQPWSAENAAGHITLPLRHDGTPYHGINVLMLWSAAVDKGYAVPTWMTYKQAQELDGQVRKGEHGSPVVFASTLHKTESGENGEEIERDIPFLKGYTVFNVEQIDGLPERFYGRPAPTLAPVERIPHAETFLRATGAEIRTGGGRAFYSELADYIQMPPIEAFRDPESYYATLAHEEVHWTKHPKRLDRDFGRKRFGDEGYAKEELVAEMGSAFLCAELEITPEVRDDHAAYIGHWLKALKDDKRLIFTAAAQAQRAVEYVKGLQPPEPQPTAGPQP